ncbi:MAG TPA: hypothetical protein VLR49_13690, partial [Ferruginibacter sp.]|nr:hypothetical protein [Ferruginibacter sp.]
SEYDAAVICSDKENASFYEQLIHGNSHYKAAANWMQGPLKAYCNEQQIGWERFPLTTQQIASLIDFTESGKLSFNIAALKILPAMIANGGGEPQEIAESLNLLQESDESTVVNWVNETLAALPDKVKEYQSGKKNLLGLFAGQVKKLSKGKADMQLVNKILEQELNK